jgi:hypothetical protein
VSDDDDSTGYVHAPGAARHPDGEDDGDAAEGLTAAELSGDSETRQGADPASVDRDLGAFRGWIVVGVLAFSLLGAPLLILWRPPGIPYWAALLALPMLPAVLLGAIGVWATTRP